MTAAVVVRIALVVLGCVVAGCVLFLMAHALWLKRSQRRREAMLMNAHSALNTLLVENPEHRDLAVLRTLPQRLQDELLVDLSRSVSGELRGHLAGIAHDLGVTARAVAGLHSPRWWRRLQSARILQALHVEGRLFLPLLKDPNPAVRAQAADWAGAYPATDVAEALLDLIEDTEALPRFAVEDALLRLGPVSVTPLALYLSSRRGRQVLPALDVAVALAQPAFIAAAIRLCSDELPGVRWRAAELLGATGGAEGVDALLNLLDDTRPQVRAAAVRALGRIGHWPAAPTIAQRLRDPAWQVRHAAAIALRSLGSPGHLLLRRFLEDSDAFAADMARHVLELPAGVEIAR